MRCFGYITDVDVAFIGLLKGLWRNTESEVGKSTLLKHSVPLPLSVVLSCGLTPVFEKALCEGWRCRPLFPLKACSAGLPGLADLMLTCRKTCQEEGSPLVGSPLNINRLLESCLPSHHTGMSLALDKKKIVFCYILTNK